MSEVKEVVDNQAAPADAGQASTTNEQNASGQAPKDISNSPASTGEPSGQPEVDYRKSYDELRPQFTKVTQELSQFRKKHDETSRTLAEMRDQQRALAEMLAKATEKPINLEEFQREFQTQGPKALDKYLKAHLQEVRKEYDARLAEQSERSMAQESQLEKFKRRHDKENYPDFDKLEPLMQEIVESDNCPLDFNKLTIPQIYDALYKLAKNAHSEEAIKAAEQMGRQKAEAALAKESQTTVAGGGKSGSTTNPADVKDIAKLRQLFVNQIGEAE